ncbi:hypothetical protein LTS08_003804 [Lithohypha guttulata]|nr:hypothetical protein LTS08_003804 [Lithohypha guttulata]
MAPSPTIRRLLKETQELSAAAKNPNPTFHAAPLSEDNLHEWHFTLLGPPAPSPYAGGIYHGRITLPPAYPMKPPNFRFLTPSGRFEVNREICLSISGFHEETWQPAWGVRLALTALRGFMSEDGTAGQVGGLESPRSVRERLAKDSKSWKCTGCGGEEENDNQKGWTNEERMKWWWNVCSEKGVNVEAEIEGLEDLPEGMNLEARDVKQDKGKQKEIPVATADLEDTAQNPEPQALTSQVLDPNGKDNVQQISESASSVVPPAAPQISSTPQTKPEVSAHGNQRIQSSFGSSPTQYQDVQPQQTRLQHIPQADSPISIDRAITVIFLALCLVILKKMFYPSSAGPLFGGYDDLRMVRE